MKNVDSFEDEFRVRKCIHGGRGRCAELCERVEGVAEEETKEKVQYSLYPLKDVPVTSTARDEVRSAPTSMVEVSMSASLGFVPEIGRWRSGAAACAGLTRGAFSSDSLGPYLRHEG
jgi:hypothetical protein